MATSDFGTYLRRHLVTSGVGTQLALSRVIAMDYGQLNKIFSGKTQRPQIETLQKLAPALKRPIAEMMAAAGYPEPRPAHPGGVAARAEEPVQYRLFDDADTFTVQEMIEYVESRPGRTYQERVRWQRERLKDEDYVEWAISVFNAFRSNSNLALQSLELRAAE